MEDGCVHIHVSNICDRYGYYCNGTAQQKSKCPEWGLVKAYEDSIITNKGSSASVKMINYQKAEDLINTPSYDGFDIFYMDATGMGVNISYIPSDKFSVPIKIYYTLTPSGKEYITDFNPDAKLIPLKLPPKHED